MGSSWVWTTEVVVFGLGQATTQIKVWLRFQSCEWLLWCQKLGEKKGTEHCTCLYTYTLIKYAGCIQVQVKNLTFLIGVDVS